MSLVLVRRTVSLPVITAFLTCLLFAPFSEIAVRYVSNDVCLSIIPKLNRAVGLYDHGTICRENSRLLVSLYFIAAAYLAAVFLVAALNWRVFTVNYLRKLDNFNIKVLIGVIVILSIAFYLIYCYAYNDIAIRRLGGSLYSYSNLREYANAQIFLLMYVVNLFLFVGIALLSSLIFLPIGDDS